MWIWAHLSWHRRIEVDGHPDYACDMVMTDHDLKYLDKRVTSDEVPIEQRHRVCVECSMYEE